MRRLFVLSVLLLLLGATGTRSEVDTLSTRDHPRTLSDSIVVTANRFGLSPDQSVWPVGLIPVQQSGAVASMPELLDGRLGLDTRQYNGVGSVATLSNWGVFNRSMLLLYNGRVVKDYSLGGFNLSDYSPDEFDRVELVKGPQSVLYGSDAVGGVLNLISRTAMANRATATTRVGSFGFQQYRVDLSRRIGLIGVGGFVDFGRADNARDNAGSRHLVLGVRSDYLSRDTRHRWTVSGRVFADSLGVPGPVPDPLAVPMHGSREASSLYDHQSDHNYSVDASYRFFDQRFGELQCDAFWENKRLDYHQLYGYWYNYYVPNGGSPGDSLAVVDSVEVYSRYRYDKKSAGLSGRYLRELGRLSWSAGVDWLSGGIRSRTDDRTVLSRHIENGGATGDDYSSESVWSGRQNQLDLWTGTEERLIAGIRSTLSGRAQFVRGRPAQPSYNLGIIWQPQRWLVGKVAYGYAFRLPSLAEQFANDPYTKGNNDLSPETARSLVVTMTIEPTSANLRAELSLFRQRIDSLIQYRSDLDNYWWVAQNVDRFKSDGVDLSLHVSPVRAWALDWSGVIQRARQTESGQFVRAYYVPNFKWRADLNTSPAGRWSGNMNIAYTSDREGRVAGATKRIGAVYELGGGVSLRLSRNLRLAVSGADLTNQRRPDQFGFSQSDYDYPSPGRRFLLELRAGWQ
jgi:outer membrane cobalamin receptor